MLQTHLLLVPLENTDNLYRVESKVRDNQKTNVPNSTTSLNRTAFYVEDGSVL